MIFFHSYTNHLLHRSWQSYVSRRPQAEYSVEASRNLRKSNKLHHQPHCIVIKVEIAETLIQGRCVYYCYLYSQPRIVMRVVKHEKLIQGRCVYYSDSLHPLPPPNKSIGILRRVGTKLLYTCVLLDPVLVALTCRTRRRIH